MAGSLDFVNKNTRCQVKFEFQINNKFFFSIKNIPYNILDVLMLKRTYYLSKIQI